MAEDVQNSSANDNRNIGNVQPSLSGPGQGDWLIPGTFNFEGGSASLNQVFVNGNRLIPNANRGIPLKTDDVLTFRGTGLFRYDRADFLYGADETVLKTVLNSSDGGGSARSFIVPDLNQSLANNGSFRIKLISRTQPQANRVIGYRLVYKNKEEKEEEKKANPQQVEEEEQREAGQGAALVNSAGLAAGAQAVRTAAGAAVGATGAAVSSGQRNVVSSQTVNEEDYDSDVESEASGQEEVSQVSGGTVSAGGQTVSESGTAGQTSTISSGGTVSGSQTTEVSSGGTVGSRISAEVSGRAGGGTATANQTISQGGTVTSRVSGGGQASQEAQAQGTSTTQVSGQSQTVAGGEVSAETKTAGTTGQPTGAAGGAALSAKAETDVKAQADVKTTGTEKSAAQTSPSSPQKSVGTPPASSPAGGESETGGKKREEPPKSPAAGQTAAGKGSVDGIGTAGKGLGGPNIGGSTNAGNTGLKPPAGLGAMKSLDVILSKNIGGNLPVVPSAEKNTSGSGPNKNASNQAAPAKPVGAPGGSPADEKEVTPPLGSGSLRGNGPESSQPNENGEQSGNGNPIDSAIPPSDENPENAAKQEGPQVGEPLQMPGENGENGEEKSNPEDQDRADDEAPKSDEEKSPEDEQDQQNAAPEVPEQVPGAATGGGTEASAAAGALANSGAGQELLKKTSGQIWWYAFGVSAATFFTGLDFLVGALGMDAYWIFGHRKEPKLFPMKAWQKVVTIFANVFPFILVTLGISFILVAGCNWPISKSNLFPTYRGTVIGAFIGDTCKTFDLSNILKGSSATNQFGGGTSGGGGASDSFGNTPATGAPVTPLGPATTPPH